MSELIVFYPTASPARVQPFFTKLILIQAYLLRYACFCAKLSS